MITINVTNGELPEEELKQLRERAITRYPFNAIKSIEVAIDGEYMDVLYLGDINPFERIRRISGYLVGTTDRWNNGKKAELKDRVKHN